jgi:hypothetical protein
MPRIHVLILQPIHKPQPYVSILSTIPRSSLAQLITAAPLCTFFLLRSISWMGADHNSVAPKNENPTTMNPMIMGVLSKGRTDIGAALLLLVAVLEAPVATAVTDPEPAVAVPVDVPEAFWLPFPERPAPVPAPDFINYYHVSIV